jgi:hypothetical protein
MKTGRAPVANSRPLFREGAPRSCNRRRQLRSMWNSQTSSADWAEIVIQHGATARGKRPDVIYINDSSGDDFLSFTYCTQFLFLQSTEQIDEEAGMDQP